MTELSEYSETELRTELDRRMKKAKNAKGFVRCADCASMKPCRTKKILKQGVWRYCEDYTELIKTI